LPTGLKESGTGLAPCQSTPVFGASPIVDILVGEEYAFAEEVERGCGQVGNRPHAFNKVLFL
jgi:hypothetical protein